MMQKQRRQESKTATIPFEAGRRAEDPGNAWRQERLFAGAGSAPVKDLKEQSKSPYRHEVFGGKKPKAFVAEVGKKNDDDRGPDDHEIDRDDVNQWGVGSCFFLAALAGMAEFNPNGLRKLIDGPQEGPEGKFFRVGLYVPEKGSSQKTRKLTWWNVTLDFTVNKYGQPAYAKEGDPGELWVMLFEKAYAQYLETIPGRGEGYNSINNAKRGGFHAGVDAVEALTGHSARSIDNGGAGWKSVAELGETLRRAAEQKAIVTAVTKEIKSLDLENAPLILIPDHRYTVRDCDGGEVKLYNPHGRNAFLRSAEPGASGRNTVKEGPRMKSAPADFSLPLAVFHKYFSNLVVGANGAPSATPDSSVVP